MAAAVLYSFGSMAAEAATIVPTGGSFGNMTPDCPSCAVRHCLRVSRDHYSPPIFPRPGVVLDRGGSHDLDHSCAELSEPLRHGCSYMDAQDTSDALDDIVVSGSMGGTIGFDLTESATTRFSLSQMPYAWTNDVSGVSITPA